MGRNLRAQIEYAIQKNLCVGQSKHSAKGKGLSYGNNKNGKIYSYSTLHSRQDVARNFSKFVKTNYGIKNVSDLKPEYAQAFLNKVCADGATDSTLQSYRSQLNSLQKNINSTYKSVNIDLSSVAVPRNGGNRKIRCNAISMEHLEILENSYRLYTTGDNGIKIGRIAGLRASEICNLQNRNVVICNENKAEVFVVNGKGGRNRKIEIHNKEQVKILEEMKRHIGTDPTSRFCPIRPDSLERNLERHMSKAVDNTGTTLKNYYQNQAFHSIRKNFAQNRYDACRNSGMSVKQSLQSVSADLGHNRTTPDLMNRYIADQW